MITVSFTVIAKAETKSGPEYIYLGDELKQMQKEREDKIGRIKSEQGLRAADTDFYARVDVRLFVQEEYYYCGPATVKQTIHSVKGWSESQDFYARHIGTTSNGTDFDALARYLINNATDDFPNYVYEGIRDYRYWMESIRYCLEVKRKPVVIDVTDFAPGSDGHFVNIDIIEVRGSDKRVRVVDPNYDRRYGGYVWYDAYDVYEKNLRHFRSSALW